MYLILPSARASSCHSKTARYALFLPLIYWLGIKARTIRWYPSKAVCMVSAIYPKAINRWRKFPPPAVEWYYEGVLLYPPLRWHLHRPGNPAFRVQTQCHIHSCWGISGFFELGNRGQVACFKLFPDFVIFGVSYWRRNRSLCETKKMMYVRARCFKGETIATWF